MCLAALWGLWVGVLEGWVRRKRLQSRPELSDDEIYKHFYVQTDISKGSVLKAWHEVADALRVPPGKLRPLDQLAKLKVKFAVVESDLDGLSSWITGLARKGNKQLPDSFETIDEVVRFAAACELG